MVQVEEEMLNEKLQTAGFFLSMPEEEQIKKRLLEIKQMKDNPDWFREENTKNYKYSQVSGVVTAKPSTAKEEEEKILVLRLSSRGITEVEQTDVQVYLLYIRYIYSTLSETEALSTTYLRCRCGCRRSGATGRRR